MGIPAASNIFKVIIEAGVPSVYLVVVASGAVSSPTVEWNGCCGSSIGKTHKVKVSH